MGCIASKTDKVFVLNGSIKSDKTNNSKRNINKPSIRTNGSKRINNGGAAVNSIRRESLNSVHEKDTPMILDEVVFAILSAQMCKIFYEKDPEKCNGTIIEHFNTKLMDIKVWSNKDDIHLSKAITGSFQSRDTSRNLYFIFFEMKYTIYEELKTMSLIPFLTWSGYKIGNAGNIFVQSYDHLRAIGLLDWVNEKASGSKSEFFVTGHGMGGGLATLFLADISVAAFKERLLMTQTESRFSHHDVYTQSISKEIRVSQRVTDNNERNKNTISKRLSMNSTRMSVNSTRMSTSNHEDITVRSSRINSVKSKRDSMQSINTTTTISKYDYFKDLDENDDGRVILPFYCATYGSPRVLAAITADKLIQLHLHDNIYRYINPNDPLPSYPASRASELGHIGRAIYYDVLKSGQTLGKDKYIDNNNYITDNNTPANTSINNSSPEKVSVRSRTNSIRSQTNSIRLTNQNMTTPLANVSAKPVFIKIGNYLNFDGIPLHKLKNDVYIEKLHEDCDRWMDIHVYNLENGSFRGSNRLSMNRRDYQTPTKRDSTNNSNSNMSQQQQLQGLTTTIPLGESAHHINTYLNHLYAYRTLLTSSSSPSSSSPTMTNSPPTAVVSTAAVTPYTDAVYKANSSERSDHISSHLGSMSQDTKTTATSSTINTDSPIKYRSPDTTSATYTTPIAMTSKKPSNLKSTSSYDSSESSPRSVSSNTARKKSITFTNIDQTNESESTVIYNPNNSRTSMRDNGNVVTTGPPRTSMRQNPTDITSNSNNNNSSSSTNNNKYKYTATPTSESKEAEEEVNNGTYTKLHMKDIYSPTEEKSSVRMTSRRNSSRRIGNMNWNAHNLISYTNNPSKIYDIDDDDIV